MSDEEKEALEILNNTEWDGFMITIKKLIEKQSKEIEGLKKIKSKLDEKNIPIETLLAEFERLEDLEDDLTTVYLNGVYDGEKKVEDKIKAKIEEYENKIKKIRSKKLINEPEDTIVITRYAHYISVLQSLLEKE